MGNQLHLPPRFRRVIQLGLTSTDDEEVKTLAHRVARFNQRYSTKIVLDVEPDRTSPTPFYNLRFTFDNAEVQEKFWLE